VFDKQAKQGGYVVIRITDEEMEKNELYGDIVLNELQKHDIRRIETTEKRVGDGCCSLS